MKKIIVTLILITSSFAFSKDRQESGIVCNTNSDRLNQNLSKLEEGYPLYQTEKGDYIYLTNDKFTISAPTAVGNQICVSVNVK